MTKNYNHQIDDPDAPSEEEIQSEIKRLRLESANIETLKREVARLSLENEFLHAQVKLIVERGKDFVLRFLAISGGKLDLKQMKIGKRADDKLNPYELVFIKAVESALARKRRQKQLKEDLKQQEKAIVKECWEAWQQDPEKYKSKAKFAKDMLDKFRPDNPADEDKHLSSSAVITGWCKEWENAKSQSAS